MGKKLFLIIIVVISSCKTNYSFVEEYPTKNSPFIDSISFSNHQAKKLLTKKQAKKLRLKTVLGKELLKNKIGISYLPLLSNNYKSIVFYYYEDDLVLQSILVNYDKNYKLIDYQMIAFDEITDNLLRAKSNVTTNQIVLEEYNFNISKTPTILTFQISENGKIIRK